MNPPATFGRGLPVASRICTLLAVVFAVVFVTSFLFGARAKAFDPNVGSNSPGYGALLLGTIACAPWQLLTVLAVAFNVRNLAAWAVLIVPPVVSCGGAFALDILAAQRPTVLTIGPVEHAGTSLDDMHAMLRVTTEKDTHRVKLETGDQPLIGKLRTYSGQIAYHGRIDMSEDLASVSATLRITSQDPFRLEQQGLLSLIVSRDDEALVLTDAPLPPGIYDVAFQADNPYVTEKPINE